MERVRLSHYSKERKWKTNDAHRAEIQTEARVSEKVANELTDTHDSKTAIQDFNPGAIGSRRVKGAARVIIDSENVPTEGLRRVATGLREETSLRQRENRDRPGRMPRK